MQIDQIRNLTDDQLDEFIRHAKAEREMRLTIKNGKIKPGDTVEFNEKASPKYLQGVRATVTKVNPKSVQVDIGPDGGRFANRGGIRAPKSIVNHVAA